jgi:hypothetical protein
MNLNFIPGSSTVVGAQDGTFEGILVVGISQKQITKKFLNVNFNGENTNNFKFSRPTFCSF